MLKSLLKILTLCGTVLLLGSCSARLNTTNTINYGERFLYEPPRQLDFPDFRLKFIGTRDNGKIGTLILAPIYEFEITSSDGTKIIGWSSGTGDIGPSIFNIQGRSYWLELLYSDQYGRLGEGEAIVTRNH